MLIEDGVTIERCKIGPNVTIEKGTVVETASWRTRSWGGSVIRKSTLHHSMLGDRVTVSGINGTASLGDDSELVGG